MALKLATCDGPPDYTYKAAYDEAEARLAVGVRENVIRYRTQANDKLLSNPLRKCNATDHYML